VVEVEVTSAISGFVIVFTLGSVPFVVVCTSGTLIADASELLQHRLYSERVETKLPSAATVLRQSAYRLLEAVEEVLVGLLGGRDLHGWQTLAWNYLKPHRLQFIYEFVQIDELWCSLKVVPSSSLS
jgi:hypothetical protein